MAEIRKNNPTSCWTDLSVHTNRMRSRRNSWTRREVWHSVWIAYSDCMMGLYRAASTQIVFGAAELVSSCPQPPTSSIRSSRLVYIDYYSSEWVPHAGIRCWPHKDVHWRAWLALASWTPDPWYMILFS